MDDNLQCFDTNEKFEDNIVEFIKGKHHQLDEGNDDDDDPIVLMTNKEAKKYIPGLQQYFIQIGNDGIPTSALSICADFVEAQCKKDKKRTTLDLFMSN